ncbi:MAG: fructose-6-phosphate aldolase [Candidatus Kariarchaeaceae archaeon]|jgi:transaldolase
MQIFIDTANLEQIKKAAKWGIIDGVTTNPTLIAREKSDFKTLIMEIVKIVDGPISVEVTSLDSSEMIEEAKKYADWHQNIVIKVPITEEGIVAIKALSEVGIKTNTTLVFSAVQAYLAAKAGTTYVSPFIGRLDDIGIDGVDVVRDILQIFRNGDYKTQVLAASIRHSQHVLRVAKLGCEVATIPMKIIEALFKHPKTDEGLDIFLSDWAKLESKK